MTNADASQPNVATTNSEQGIQGCLQSELVSDASSSCVAEEESHEPCPPPLAWEQVLQAFRTQSTPFSITSGGHIVTGRMYGSGSPLYFLNGIGGTCELYALSTWLLQDEFRCVIFDYPSALPDASEPNDSPINQLSQCVFDIADHFEDTKFDLYATSFGSTVGLNCLLMQTDRINRAIIQGGFAHRQLSFCERLIGAACRRIQLPFRFMPLRKAIQRRNHRIWFPPFDFTRWEFFSNDTGQVPVSQLARRGLAIKNLDLRSRLPQINQPVLLIYSEGEGPLAKRCLEDLERGLPNSTTELLHTSGHLPYLTHPHRLTKLIRQFLGETR